MTFKECTMTFLIDRHMVLIGARVNALRHVYKYLKVMNHIPLFSCCLTISLFDCFIMITRYRGITQPLGTRMWGRWQILCIAGTVLLISFIRSISRTMFGEVVPLSLFKIQSWNLYWELLYSYDVFFSYKVFLCHNMPLLWAGGEATTYFSWITMQY